MNSCEFSRICDTIILYVFSLEHSKHMSYVNKCYSLSIIGSVLALMMGPKITHNGLSN